MELLVQFDLDNMLVGRVVLVLPASLEKEKVVLVLVERLKGS